MMLGDLLYYRADIDICGDEQDDLYFFHLSKFL